MSSRVGLTIIAALVMSAAPAKAFDFIFLDAASQYAGTAAVNSYLDPECEPDDADRACETGHACGEQTAREAGAADNVNVDEEADATACASDESEPDE